MKKKTGLYVLLIMGLVLAGCTQKNESEPPIATTQPLEVEKGLTKDEKYIITAEDLEEQQQLEEARARVKEQIRLQKEERKKREQNPRGSNTTKPKETTTKEPTKVGEKEPIRKPKDNGTGVKEPTKGHAEHEKEEESAIDGNMKELELKKEIPSYRTIFEVYIRENMTKDFTIEELNTFLGRKNQVSGTNLLALETEQKNPWGKPYQIELNKAEQKVVLRVYDDKQKGYILATYYHEGVIATCMSGFEKDDVALTLPLQKGHVCGGNLNK